MESRQKWLPSAGRKKSSRRNGQLRKRAEAKCWSGGIIWTLLKCIHNCCPVIVLCDLYMNILVGCACAAVCCRQGCAEFGVRWQSCFSRRICMWGRYKPSLGQISGTRVRWLSGNRDSHVLADSTPPECSRYFLCGPKPTEPTEPVSLAYACSFPFRATSQFPTEFPEPSFACDNEAVL